MAIKISKEESLKEKLRILKEKLHNEEVRENNMLASRGWGYGMRHSKISFSTTKSDNYKRRIAEIEEKLIDLKK